MIPCSRDRWSRGSLKAKLDGRENANRGGNNGMLTIDLTDKVALVIGGSRGIGGAITANLCEAGATTVFTHTGRPEYAEAVAAFEKRLREAGGKVRSAALDACDSAGTTAQVDAITAREGRLDVLVINVGRNPARTPDQITDASWRELIDLNLTGAFYAVRAALPHMVAQKCGRIILIGSSAAFAGGGGAIDYAAAKAGLAGMMHYLNKTYARTGILTNIVHPCVIETDLLRERYPDDEAKRTLVGQIPAGRLGRPEDIAGLVAYLASPWGDYICGQEILLDGGRTLYG